jgi:hypothetical protein
MLGDKPSSRSWNTPVCAMIGYTSKCVILSLALILVVKFLGGGGTSSGLVASLSIGNGLSRRRTSQHTQCPQPSAMLNKVSASIETSCPSNSTNPYATSSHLPPITPPTFYNDSNISSPKLCIHLPSKTHARPFDLSFNPDLTPLPLINHTCPYTTIGFDITITALPPCPSFDPTSTNVTTILTANDDSHLQKYQKRTGSTIGITTTGNTVICNLLDRNMVLIPLAVDHFGHIEPRILQTFLFDTQPMTHITFTPTKPNTT